MKEHYVWYKEYKRYEFGRIKKEPTPPVWRNVKGWGSGSYTEPDLINFKVDNGNEVQFWPPWCGYFETLYGAEIFIVSEEDNETNDLSFEI